MSAGMVWRSWPRLMSRVVVVALLLLGSVAEGFAAPLPPSPTVSPAASQSCASAVPDLPIDLQAAFAYDLESPTILRFITALATLPQRKQKRVFDQAARAAASVPERRTSAAVAALCPNLDEIYGTSRALYLIANEWNLPDLTDSNRFADFSSVVRTAVWSLSVADRLTAEQRATGMLPFSNLAALTPSAQPSPQGCSPDAPARVLHVVQVNYPPLAQSASTTGSVLIKVALNGNGDIRSARLYHDTLHARQGAQDLVNVTIVAAASSTYAPEIRNCKTFGGVYLFSADYSRG